jgi:hypothetical protein
MFVTGARTAIVSTSFGVFVHPRGHPSAAAMTELETTTSACLSTGFT